MKKLSDTLRTSLSNLMPLSNNEKIEVLHYIFNQEQEIKRLKEENEDLQNRFNSLMEAHKICDEDNERLNNNWNELEKWIEKERDKWEKYNPDCFAYYQSILDRMKEI